MNLIVIAEHLSIEELDTLHGLYQKYTQMHNDTVSVEVEASRLKECANILGDLYVGHLYADIRRYDTLSQNPWAVSYCYEQYQKAMHYDLSVWKILYDFFVSHHIQLHCQNNMQQDRDFVFLPTRKEHMLWNNLGYDGYLYGRFFDGISADFIRDFDEDIIIESAYYMLKYSKMVHTEAIVQGLEKWMYFLEDIPKESRIKPIVALYGSMTVENIETILHDAMSSLNVHQHEEVVLHVEL